MNILTEGKSIGDRSRSPSHGLARKHTNEIPLDQVKGLNLVEVRRNLNNSRMLSPKNHQHSDFMYELAKKQKLIREELTNNKTEYIEEFTFAPELDDRSLQLARDLPGTVYDRSKVFIQRKEEKLVGLREQQKIEEELKFEESMRKPPSRLKKAPAEKDVDPYQEKDKSRSPSPVKKTHQELVNISKAVKVHTKPMEANRMPFK